MPCFLCFLPHFTPVISGTKYNNALYIMPQSFIHNVVIPVSFLRFAIGNRRARSWQPHGPQPETGQPAIEKRSFTPFRTVFYTIHKREKDGMKQEKQQVFPTFLTLLFLYLPRSAALSAGCPAATRLHHNGLQTLSGCHSSALSCPMRRNNGQSSRQNHRRAHRLQELPPTCGRVSNLRAKPHPLR